MTTMIGLSDDDGKFLISDTLRLFVGHGRRISWADLAAATGDEERKLRSYVERDPPAMPAMVMMRVFAALPPEAWARINNRMGYAAPGALDAPSTNWLAIGQRMASFTGKVMHFQATGPGIDHREDAELREDILTIISEGQGAVLGG